jgi:hypothetical protein
VSGAVEIRTQEVDDQIRPQPNRDDTIPSIKSKLKLAMSISQPTY